MYETLDRPSLHLCRANPKLTTNVKLVTNGKDIWLDSFGLVGDLSDDRYKAFKVSPLGYYNKDICEFYKGIDADVIYSACQEFDDTVINKRYDEQYETLYWSGCEYISSLEFDESLGILAPLWIGDKLPTRFCVFRVEDPTYRKVDDHNVSEEMSFDIRRDVLNKCVLIKTFDLREGCVFGDYLHRYVSQDGFPTSPLYVNYDESGDSVYYGFSVKNGVFMSVPEHDHKRMFNNDDPIMVSDSYVTDGWRRNRIAVANLLNIQFLFDDDGVEDYSFNRYFGFYCDFVDVSSAKLDMTRTYINGRLYDVYIPDNVVTSDIGGVKLTVVTDAPPPTPAENGMLAVEDKEGGLHSVEEIRGLDAETEESDEELNRKTMLITLREKSTNASLLCGVAPCDIDLYGELRDDTLNSYTILRTTDAAESSNIIITFGMFKYEYDENYEDNYHSWCEEIGTVTSDESAGHGRFKDTGTASDMARGIAEAINGLEMEELSATVGGENGDYVVVSARRVVTTNYGHFCVSVTCEGTAKVYVYPQHAGTTNVAFSNGTTNGYFCTDSLDMSDDEVFLYDEENNYYAKSSDDKRYTKLIKDDSLPAADNPDSMNLVFDRRLSKSANTLSLYSEYHMKVGRLAFVPVFDFDTSFVEHPSTYGKYEGLLKYNADTKTYFSIDNEYDAYGENYNKGTMMVSRTVPFILKWGADGGTDVYNRPYRHNTSSVFGFNSFAPNPYVDSFSKDMFNGDWQYIMSSDVETSGRYIHIDEDTDFDTVVENLLYTGDDRDWFGEYFYDRSSPTEPCKYTSIRRGSSTRMASTFFRGVKVNVCDKDDYTELPSASCRKRYGDTLNGYRFAVASVVYDMKSAERPVIVRNDKHGTITVVLPFMKEIWAERIPTSINEDDDYHRDFEAIAIADVYKTENIYSEERMSASTNENGRLIPLLIGEKGVTYANTHHKINVTEGVVDALKAGDYILFTSANVADGGIYDITPFAAEVVSVSRNSVEYESVDLPQSVWAGDEDNVQNVIGEHGEYNYENTHHILPLNNPMFSHLYLLADAPRLTDIVNKYNDMARYDNVFSAINNIGKSNMRMLHVTADGDKYDTDNGEYTTYITLVPPEYHAKYEYLVCNDGVEYSTNSVQNLGSSMLNRYSCFCAPVMRCVLGAYATGDCGLNTSLGIDAEDAGVIPMLAFHKVNERTSDIYGLVPPQKATYPKSGRFAIGYMEKFNVFRPRWADMYYTRTLSEGDWQYVYGTASMTERKSMFGSVCMHAADTVSVTSFTGYDGGIESYVKKLKISGNSVSFDILGRDILRDTLFARMRGIFNDYIYTPDGFGDVDTTDDDVYEYIDRNLVGLYKISECRIYAQDIRNVNVSRFSVNVGFVDEKPAVSRIPFKRMTDISSTGINANHLDRRYRLTVPSNYRRVLTVEIVFELR